MSWFEGRFHFLRSSSGHLHFLRFSSLSKVVFIFRPSLFFLGHLYYLGLVLPWLSEEEPDDMSSKDKIIIPSPKVSIDENDIPIIVRNTASFEERILEASPDAAVPLELTPCDICVRKLNHHPGFRKAHKSN